MFFGGQVRYVALLEWERSEAFEDKGGGVGRRHGVCWCVWMLGGRVSVLECSTNFERLLGLWSQSFTDSPSLPYFLGACGRKRGTRETVLVKSVSQGPASGKCGSTTT